MFEAHATVQAVEPGYAWVESERRSACGSCASSARCGVSTVAKLIATRRLTLRLRDPLGVQPGESVVIGVSENQLLGVAAVAYLFPLFAMIAIALVASVVSDAEAAPPLGAMVGLVGTLALLRLLRRGRVQYERHQPVILRRTIDRAVALVETHPEVAKL